MKRKDFAGRTEKRQKEALARREARQALTPAQQLAKLDRGGFAAVRERARLQKAIQG